MAHRKFHGGCEWTSLVKGNNAHIHAHVYGAGYSERSIADYWFKDDPRINDEELKNAAANGSHPFLIELKRGSDGSGGASGISR